MKIIFRLSKILPITFLMAGCSTMDSSAEVYGYVKGYANLPIMSGCSSLAHSKKYNKIVLSCLVGNDPEKTHFDLKIISTKTNSSKTISNIGLDTYPKPFVYQNEQSYYLYFPGGHGKPAIRQVDVNLGTYVDRAIMYAGEGEYSGAYLNPLAGCLVISSSVSTGDGTAVDLLQAYSYDPLSSKPIDASQPSPVSIRGPNLSLGSVNPDDSHVACSKNSSGELRIYVAYGKYRDFGRGASGQYIKEIDKHGSKNIIESEGTFRFSQQKTDSKIYAYNWGENYIVELDIGRDSVETLGGQSGGVWYDYAPDIRKGLLAKPTTLADGTSAFVVCPASIDTGVCEAPEFTVTTRKSGWFAHTSSGWSGDGLYFGTDRQINSKSDSGPYSESIGIVEYWY